MNGAAKDGSGGGCGRALAWGEGEDCGPAAPGSCGRGHKKGTRKIVGHGADFMSARPQAASSRLNRQVGVGDPLLTCGRDRCRLEPPCTSTDGTLTGRSIARHGPPTGGQQASKAHCHLQRAEQAEVMSGSALGSCTDAVPRAPKRSFLKGAAHDKSGNLGKRLSALCHCLSSLL